MNDTHINLEIALTNHTFEDFCQLYDWQSNTEAHGKQCMYARMYASVYVWMDE